MAEARYAVVETATGKIVNIILWDGDETKWSPQAAFGPGHTVRLATAADAIAPTVSDQSTISTADFYARFTDAEKAGIASASVAVPQIFVGLIHGLANGSIDLIDAELKAWMGGLVSTGVLTAAREIAILTP